MCLQVTSAVKIDKIRKISLNYGMNKIYGAYRSGSKENQTVMLTLDLSTSYSKYFGCNCNMLLCLNKMVRIYNLSNDIFFFLLQKHPPKTTEIFSLSIK